MTFVIRLAVIARIHFLDSVIQKIALDAYLLKADLFIMILCMLPEYPGKDDERGGRESNPVLQDLEKKIIKGHCNPFLDYIFY